MHRTAYPLFEGRLGRETGAVAGRVLDLGAFHARLFRFSAAATECDPGFDFDGVLVLSGTPSPARFFQIRTNAWFALHDIPLYQCNAGAFVAEPALFDIWDVFLRPDPSKRTLAVTLDWPGFQYAPVGCGLADVNGEWKPGSAAPARTEIVELEDPPSLPALWSYTWSAGPRVKRVIGSLPSGEVRGLDVQGVRFLGIRIADAPPPPVLGPLWVPYGSPNPTLSDAATGRCAADVTVSFD